jgi:NADH:ubiquinone oxidoreductase subunit 5 (subunit L)/multisubunit Na+/H+ antiporter MnhA subunit
MKKLISFLALFALVGLVAAQEEQKKGGTLEDLSSQIQRFNDITAKNTEIIKGIPGLIEEQYKRQTGSIIVGTSIFLLAMYCGVFFFDRLRKIRKKKSHEEYIKDLEDRLTLQGSAYIQQLKEHDIHATQLLTEVSAIRDRIRAYSDDYPQKKQDKTVYYAMLIFGIGGICIPVYANFFLIMSTFYGLRFILARGT